jgi:hypothetical protein
MDFNFFNWIREGTKRAVLLGVADAADTMGAPHEETSSREKILTLFNANAQDERKRLSSNVGSTSSKKLGRTLSDINSAKE